MGAGRESLCLWPAAGGCELFVVPPERDGHGSEEEEAEEEGGPAAAANSVPPWVPPRHRPVYKTELCTYFPLGECRYGERCLFAHGDAELRVPHTGGSLPRDG